MEAVIETRNVGIAMADPPVVVSAAVIAAKFVLRSRPVVEFPAAVPIHPRMYWTEVTLVNSM